MKLVIKRGCDEHNSEKTTICGTDYLIHEYDWYMDDALLALEELVCDKDGEIKPRHENSIKYAFVRRFRNAIRENFQHCHDIAPDFRTLSKIRAFIKRVEYAENDKALL